MKTMLLNPRMSKKEMIGEINKLKLKNYHLEERLGNLIDEIRRLNDRKIPLKAVLHGGTADGVIHEFGGDIPHYISTYYIPDGELKYAPSFVLYEPVELAEQEDKCTTKS